MLKRSTRILALSAMSIALPTGPLLAQDDYPAERSEMIIAASAGSGADITGRIVASALERMYDGATYQIRNMPGAGLQVGMQALADSDADGYTFGLTSLPTVITLSMDEQRNAQFDRDSFLPLGNFVYDPGAIAVHADSEFESLSDLVDSANQNPGERTVGVTGHGGREHLDVMSMEQAANVDFTPVFHDDSGLAVNSLLGGNIDAVEGSVADFASQVEAGRLRVIAVFDEERSEFMPDVPTGAEQGVELYTGTSRGFAMPAGAPEEIADALSQAIGEIAASEDAQMRVNDMGLELRHMDRQEYAEYWDSQMERIERLKANLDTEDATTE